MNTGQNQQLLMRSYAHKILGNGSESKANFFCQTEAALALFAVMPRKQAIMGSSGCMSWIFTAQKLMESHGHWFFTVVKQVRFQFRSHTYGSSIVNLA